MITIKPKRGQKVCSSCNTINGVRSFECKNCSHPFKMKKFPKTKKKVLISNHKELVPGDTIRVVGGSGPYFIGDDNLKHYCSDRGKYVVNSIDEDGLWACAPNGGNVFLYMGQVKKSPVFSKIIRAPHKILLLKNRKR